MLQSLGSQGVSYNLATEQQQQKADKNLDQKYLMLRTWQLDQGPDKSWQSRYKTVRTVEQEM